MFLAGLGGIQAQITFSPYSRFGLGDVFDPSSSRNFSMGGIGIGAYDGTTINRINPASYADIRLTTLDLSLFGRSSLQETNSNSGWRSTGGFHNGSFAFSNRGNFGFIFGLAPYSATGYDISSTSQVLVDSNSQNLTTNYLAEGGLNQFYVGFGVKFFKKLSVGANLVYAFGSTNFSWTSDFADATFQNVLIEKRINASGLLPQFGLQFGDTLKIRREVDRIKFLDDRIGDMNSNIKNIDKDLAKLGKMEEKVLTKSAERDAEKQEIVNEKTQLEGQVAGLMKNESANEKEIGQLQERIYKLEKRRKKIERINKSEQREIRDAIARLEREKKKMQDKQKQFAGRQEQVRNGKLSSTVRKQNSLLYRVGLIMEPGVRLNGSQLFTVDNSQVKDTINLDESGFIQMPLKYGIGFTLSKPTRWMAGADVTFQDWSNFQYFDQSNTFRNTLKVNVGGEFIPGIISSKYLRRVAYRGGFYFKQSNLNIDGQDINEMGFTIGFGIPMGRFNVVARDFSRLNLGLDVGRRGTLESNLLQETTFRFRLGVNLNDVWFIKRRIN